MTLAPGPGLSLSHFQAFLLFAAVISIAFGYLGRRRTNDRLRYILWSFFLFLAVGIGLAWVMYPFSR
ncbi:MAG TPA: hypothetical protein VKH45_02970 [Candidatus Acidoferrum sp.]|nr:hypothetical protein [Candidatus Acidoferrum sp.]